MRETLLKTGVTLAMFAVVSGSVFADSQTIVLRGARILTIDEAEPETETIALVDGRIAAVGTAEDVAPFLKGAKLVLPGFYDSHTHLLSDGAASAAGDLRKVVGKEASAPLDYHHRGFRRIGERGCRHTCESRRQRSAK
ncbi:hypothetical protein [Mesorhizobium sp. ISC15]|uniref:hypothetical protein n=1 Tax=Mesorhizobium sp. ISC15 TaxID=3076429 RepID=UPI00301CD489